MPGIHINVGLRYRYRGATFLIRKCLGDDHLQVENLQSGEQQTIPLQGLLEAYAREELCFERLPLHPRARRDRSEHPEDLVPDVTSVPAGPLRNETERRLETMQWVKRLPPEQRNRQGFQALAKELKALEAQPLADVKKRRPFGHASSASSIARWWRDYKASGEDIRVLIPKRPACGSKSNKRTDPGVETLIVEVLTYYAHHPRARTLRAVMDDLQDRFDEANKDHGPAQPFRLPSRSTIYRRLQETDASLLIRGRRSRSKAKQEGRRYRAPKPKRILQRVEIDHTRLPFLLVDEVTRLPIGFPTLTAAMDACSGLVLGIFVGFEPPGALAVQNCLLHAVLPKADTRELYGTQHEWVAYGIPEMVVIGENCNGTGRSLEEACKQFGITLVQLPGCSPWLKGRIYRFFRTMIKRLGVQTLWDDSKLMSICGDTCDPEKHICISQTDFWRILHLFLVDDYAHRWQKSVQGVPYLLWMEQVQAGRSPGLPWSAKAVRDLLRSSTHPRTIGRKGIEFEGLFYNSPELAALRCALQQSAAQGDSTTETNEAGGSRPGDEAPSDTVAVTYDPGDLSAIYAWSSIHSGGTWLRVPAVDQEYTQGLTFWTHRVIRKYQVQKQRALDSASLHTAKQAIQKVVDQEFQLTRQSTRGRKKAARYSGPGIQPVPGVEAMTGVASFTSATVQSTTSSPSAIPAEPSLGVAGDRAAAPAIADGFIYNRDSQQSVSASLRKPRRTAKKKPAAPIALPTSEPLLAWDITGWGGDDAAPRPLSIQL